MNITQLGVGVGDTVPVGVGVDVSVALAVVVGVGVQGSIDEDDELIMLLAELELFAAGVSVARPVLELAPKLALDELELSPKLLSALELELSRPVELLSPVELEPKPVVSVELEELEPAAPALGPHATIKAAMATKATKTIANLFILSPFLLAIYLLHQAQALHFSMRGDHIVIRIYRRASEQGITRPNIPRQELVAW